MGFPKSKKKASFIRNFGSDGKGNEKLEAKR
jgi:hypothetical protein